MGGEIGPNGRLGWAGDGVPGPHRGKPYLCVEQQFQMRPHAAIGTPGAHQINLAMDQ